MRLKINMYKLYKNFDELCEVVVDKLEDNKIIGWFQGKSDLIIKIILMIILNIENLGGRMLL